MKYTITSETMKKARALSMSQGILRIDVESGGKGSKTILSDWIDTGLGPGRHSVTTAFVDAVLLDDMPLGEERLFFGRSDYFEDAGDIPAVPEVKTAAVLNVETGKIRLALRVKPASFTGTIRVLWNAVKLNEEAAEAVPEETAAEEIPAVEEETEEAPEKELRFFIENPPKFLHPGWKYTFRVHYDGIFKETDRILWSLSSESGEGEEYTGSIDKFGQLTAPEKPGIVEVTATVEGTDLACSSYVMVTPGT